MHRHCEHAERRGRTVKTTVSSRTPRSLAWPHGRSSPVQSGQRSSPAIRSWSTSSGHVPTISNGCLSAPSDGPPFRPRNGEGCCVSRTSSRSRRQQRRATHPAAQKIIVTLNDARTPTRRQPAWRSTARCSRARRCSYVRWTRSVSRTSTTGTREDAPPSTRPVYHQLGKPRATSALPGAGPRQPWTRLHTTIEQDHLEPVIGDRPWCGER